MSGSDHWIDGKGSTRWKLLGLIPFVHAGGPDISRAAFGRFQIEAIWLPTLLLGHDVAWSVSDSAHVSADLRLSGQPTHLELGIEPNGGLRTARIQCWGNPDEKRGFAEQSFGAIVSEERTFDGITIPTAMRVGWYFGSSRFETEGEFFRATVDHAEFR